MNTPKYRHEIKHFINYSDYLQIRNRLKHIASIDTSSTSNGRYKIRSLYFDNIYDKVLMEKINGFNKREKFRIRFYNNDTSFIRLEKKSKNNGLCLKESTILTKEQCKDIINNNLHWIKDSTDNLLLEFYSKCKYQLLKPKTIVDYVREAFVYEPGNVRITFDMDIRTGIYSNNIFNPSLPVAPTDTNLIILEVKYDEFLPEIINNAIQTNNRKAATISKYAASRIYG